MIVSTKINYTTRRKLMTDKKIRPFGKKDELGYVFGDMAGSFVNLFIDGYFLTFCTYESALHGWDLYSSLQDFGMQSTTRSWDPSRTAG